MEYLEPVALDEAFFDYVAQTEVDIIIDVGSRDAGHAAMFRRFNDDADIYAFEASPENYHEFGAVEQRIFSKRVRFIPLGISDKNGMSEVHIPEGMSQFDDADRGKRGQHSLLPRNDTPTARTYQVPTVRLDTFFEIPLEQKKTFGMWIDVEGATLPVLRGGVEVLARTKYLKVELSSAQYWVGQSSDTEVIAFLETHGFDLAYQSPNEAHYDGLFLKRTS